MQNKYVGDVGDFGKYGLLRHLGAALALGVVWYLVPDETRNNDGRHVRYLNLDQHAAARCGVASCNARDARRHTEAFRACDPVLYDTLRDLVTRGDRHVGTIARRGILPRGTVFVEDVLSEPRRGEWFNRALHMTRKADLVFLDPDNGLEVASRPSGSRLATKYAFCEEVKTVYMRGQSIVLYQHVDRRADLSRRCRTRLVELLGCRWESIHAVRFRRGTARIFWIVPAARHELAIADQVGSFLAGRWGRHFKLERTAATTLLRGE